MNRSRGRPTASFIQAQSAFTMVANDEIGGISSSGGGQTGNFAGHRHPLLTEQQETLGEERGATGGGQMAAP